MKSPEPKWEDHIPFCSHEECSSYDGKRCELMGFRPSTVCEPEVRDIVIKYDALLLKLSKSRQDPK